MYVELAPHGLRAPSNPNSGVSVRGQTSTFPGGMKKIVLCCHTTFICASKYFVYDTMKEDIYSAFLCDDPPPTDVALDSGGL